MATEATQHGECDMNWPHDSTDRSGCFSALWATCMALSKDRIGMMIEQPFLHGS